MVDDGWIFGGFWILDFVKFCGGERDHSYIWSKNQLKTDDYVLNR
jgi:hypothetical protein